MSGDKAGLDACPFCREMFPRGEAQVCPVCGVALRPFETLPLSADAAAQEDPIPPEEVRFSWRYGGRHRGATAATALAGLLLFFLPWVHVTLPDVVDLSGFGLARRLGWSWGAGVAWFVLVPTVLSRRTILQLRGARVAAAFLAAVPAVTVCMLLARPPRGGSSPSASPGRGRCGERSCSRWWVACSPFASVADARPSRRGEHLWAPPTSSSRKARRTQAWWARPIVQRVAHAGHEVGDCTERRTPKCGADWLPALARTRPGSHVLEVSVRPQARGPRRAGRSAGKELDDVFDRVDVPAAIVCAVCGDAECPGCDGQATRSGVVALVPWERPGMPLGWRLWATARGATCDAERFFETLADGSLATALTFAFLAEVLGVAGLASVVVLAAAAFAPLWLARIVRDPTSLELALLSVPAFAAWMVLAHLVHALALAWGARRSGARASLRRALRFGLYACGWDLALSPGGALVSLVGGASGLTSLFLASSGLPGRSTRAFLRGTYRLEGDRAKPALWMAMFGAVVATLVGASAVVIAITILALR